MRAVTIALAVSLVLGGCSAAGGYLPPGPATAVGATSDVNPQNPTTLRDGGDLRLALTEFPSNFNTLHIDGNSADVGGMLKATLPRAFVIGPDGSTTVDTDYFSSAELTGTNPQVVTYTINPKATWSDGSPLSWEDIASQDPRHQRGRQNVRHRRHQWQRTGEGGDPGRRRPPGSGHLRQAIRRVARHVRRQRHAAAQEHDCAPPRRSTRRSSPAPVRRPGRSSSRRWIGRDSGSC